MPLDFIAVQCYSCQARRATRAARMQLSSAASRHAAALTLPHAALQAFQVQRGGKKVDAFACKVCGAKQSTQKVFGRSGRAADVRGTVQALNTARASAADRADAALAARFYGGGADADEEQAEGAGGAQERETDAATAGAARGSRWADFLDAEAEDAAPEAVRGAGAAAAADEAERDGEAADARFTTPLLPPPLHGPSKRARGESAADDAWEPAARVTARRGGGPEDARDHGWRENAPAARLTAAPATAAARLGGWAAPAPQPLSPRGRSNAAAPPAPPAAAGKWAAFAAAPDDDEW
jgi:hypothetical protein